MIQACESQILRVLRSSESAACAYLQFELGVHYYVGSYGVEVNVTKAREHFEIAANMGYSLACYFVARDMEWDGCTHLRAAEWYMQAAKQCDCWPEGNCALDSDIWPKDHCASVNAQIRLAEAYEGGGPGSLQLSRSDIGTYSNLGQ